MKDDNLPPNNETVEDGGGCYVAGSREEYNAYLNYEDVQKELETAKDIIKELIPIAEAGAIMQEHFIIDRAKQFIQIRGK